MATIKELKKQMESKKQHIGCLCCGGSEEILPMDTRLYNGFGGWCIVKDGQHYFAEESDKEWEENRMLSEIEEEAKKFPKSKWEANLFLPLRETYYERADCGNWVLIKTGMGFA